jgi:hypothetical protein
MAGFEVDLLAIDRGSVTAPAGCGKTHHIAEALTRHGEGKPILILTHTNAGVVALRERLDRAGVPSRSYKLSTIDGWAIRIISMFPLRSGHNPDILKLETPATDTLRSVGRPQIFSRPDTSTRCWRLATPG